MRVIVAERSPGARARRSCCAAGTRRISYRCCRAAAARSRCATGRREAMRKGHTGMRPRIALVLCRHPGDQPVRRASRLSTSSLRRWPAGTNQFPGTRQNRYRCGPSAVVAHGGLIRGLPNGRGRRAQGAAPGDPGADSTAATARGGAGMTARTVETTGGSGGEEDGPHEWAIDTSTQAAMGRIMPWKRLNCLGVEHKRHLLTLQSVVKLSERPATVVGRGPSGESRLVSVVCEGKQYA